MTIGKHFNVLFKFLLVSGIIYLLTASDDEKLVTNRAFIVRMNPALLWNRQRFRIVIIFVHIIMQQRALSNKVNNLI